MKKNNLLIQIPAVSVAAGALMLAAAKITTSFFLQLIPYAVFIAVLGAVYSASVRRIFPKVYFYIILGALLLCYTVFFAGIHIIPFTGIEVERWDFGANVMVYLIGLGISTAASFLVVSFPSSRIDVNHQRSSE